MTTIWTVGHSNKGLADLIDLLDAADITKLVDVRTYPSSKYNPQFNREAMVWPLHAAGIEYRYHGKNLGGRGTNRNYDQTLDRLVKEAEAGDHIALMCSEGSPAKCHRKYMLTPDLLKRGVSIEHILWDGTLDPEEPAETLFDVPESEIKRSTR